MKSPKPITMYSTKSKIKQALTRGGQVAVVVIVIVILAGGGLAAYYLTKSGPTTTNTNTNTTSTTNTGSTNTTSGGQFTLNPSNSSQLIDESPLAAYDSLDPSYGFFVVDGYFANVFQGLVQFNGTSSTEVVPSLAVSWNVSSNLQNYTFQMRPNTWFSNKDPINSYVAWFSFVRVLWMNAPTTVGYSNYVSLTFNSSSVGTDGNIWPWGLKAALAANGAVNTENGLTSSLNHMMSNFNPANATQQAIMSYPSQAYVASSNSTFKINLIQPYGLFLLDLPPQWGAIQDPTFIDANGGVINNTKNVYISTNGMPGSGPYMYQANPPAGQTLLVLNENTNYWAKGVSGLNSVLQPAQIATIVMEFGNQPNTEIADFGSNKAQLINPPISQFGQTYSSYNYKSHFTFNQVFANAGYPLCDLAFGLNTQSYPTNITMLRQAIVHAVNYSSIEQQLFTYNGQSFGQLFLPPVPPGWGTLDNPQNTSLYSYNITMAAQLVNQAGLKYGFYTVMANGTILGDSTGTQLAPINFDYIVPLTPALQTQIAIMQDGLGQIGVRVVPTGITTGIYDALETSPQNTANIVGVGWCADWPDPMFQQFYDMATTAAHQPNWVNNATLNALLAKIPFETNATQQLADTNKAYQIFTQLSTIIQAPNPATTFFVQPYVKGLEYSPFQFAVLYNQLSYQTATGS